MRGVVLETNKRKALILKEDGSFVHMPNRGFSVGEEIETERIPYFRLNWVAALAASFILVFTVSVYAYFAPSAYVSLDVNPSIELTLNRFSRVIETRAADETTESLLEQLQLRNKHVDEAFRLTLRQMDSMSLFSKNEKNYLVVSVAARNQERAQYILTHIVDTVSASAEAADLDIDIQQSLTSLEYAQQARNMGTTPGKLRLIQILRDASEDPESVKNEDWIGEPVRNIMRHMHADRSGQTEQIPAEGSKRPKSPGPGINPSDSGPYGPQNPEINPGPEEPKENGNTAGQAGEASSPGKQNGS
jgi:hypothetical protein